MKLNSRKPSQNVNHFQKDKAANLSNSRASEIRDRPSQLLTCFRQNELQATRSSQAGQCSLRLSGALFDGYHSNTSQKTCTCLCWWMSQGFVAEGLRPPNKTQIRLNSCDRSLCTFGISNLQANLGFQVKEKRCDECQIVNSTYSGIQKTQKLKMHHAHHQADANCQSCWKLFGGLVFGASGIVKHQEDRA